MFAVCVCVCVWGGGGGGCITQSIVMLLLGLFLKEKILCLIAEEIQYFRDMQSVMSPSCSPL